MCRAPEPAFQRLLEGVNTHHLCNAARIIAVLESRFRRQFPHTETRSLCANAGISRHFERSPIQYALETDWLAECLDALSGQWWTSHHAGPLPVINGLKQACSACVSRTIGGIDYARRSDVTTNVKSSR